MTHKLEFTGGVASFEIKDILKEYPQINTDDFAKLVEIVPQNITENKKYEYLKLACQWFVQGIAVPLIKQYIENLIKRK